FSLLIQGLLLSCLVVLCRSSQSHCCPASERCTIVTRKHIQTQPKVPYHAAKIEETSLAPWNYTYDKNDSRVPQTIRNATCSDCMVKGLKAVPIQYEMNVFHRKKCGSTFVTCIGVDRPTV
uniref:Uncharacterized protein n=1 Tax=Oncorhynchus kisutch TaxID=8019 RepID=A0A8C7JX95_ONCKI